MSRKEYMEKLDLLLRDIPHTERQEALKYYEDYFEDAGAEHEADVIEELGSPEELAKKLREDLKREETDAADEKRSREKESGRQESGAQSGESRAFAGTGPKGGARPPRKRRKGVKALNVCFIVLGVLFGIGQLAFLTGKGIFWITTYRYVYTEDGEALAHLLTKTYEAQGEDGIRNLDIEIDAGALTVEYWGGKEISVSYPDACIEAEQDGDELSLKTKGNWFSRWSYRIRNGEAGRIVIKIPRGYVFEEAAIATGAGTAEIERLEAASLELSTGVGELEAEEILVTDFLTIDAGAGETAIHNLQAKDSEFSIGVGELYLSGSVDGDITVDCGVGELAMELTNRETDFNYDISCGVGEVSINGESYSGIGQAKEKNNGAVHDFQINCGVGEINVKFLDSQR